MRNISLIFLALTLSLSSTLRAAQATCATDLAKLEIASLILERSKLSAPDEVALRLLVDKNVREKLADYQKAYGIELDAAEIRALIAKFESRDTEKVSRTRATETRARKNERSAFESGELFTKNFGVELPLSDTYFDMGEQVKGQGVQWTGDEKYVIFRNIYEESWIYNTSKRNFISYKPRAGGVMSIGGHLFAEYAQGQTTIVDLDNGQRFGPFDGEPVRSDFTNDFILTRSNFDPKGVKQDLRQYTLRQFRSGRKVEFGYTHTFSADYKKVAYVKNETTIETVDLVTSRVVDRVNADRTDRPIVFRVDGMISYPKDGKHKMKRLSDLQEFDLPYTEPAELSADGEKVIFKTVKSKRGAYSTVIYDLVTKKLTRFKVLVDLTMSPDGTKVILFSHGSNKGTTLVDLKTMATQTLAQEYKEFSPNGRWLHFENVWSHFHFLYDLQTNEVRTFQGGDDFTFIGKSNKILVTSGGAAYISDLTHWNGSAFAVEVGKSKARASRSGRFLMTYNAAGEMNMSANSVQHDEASAP